MNKPNVGAEAEALQREKAFSSSAQALLVLTRKKGSRLQAALVTYHASDAIFSTP
jgi:hypothetical protein